MKLNASQREQLRLTILRLCLDPLRPSLLLCYLRSEGFAGLQAEQLELEMTYLSDKKLITSTKSPVSAELKHWRTNAKGRDCLANQRIE